ncbi:MAG: SDR family NAD(P)-dependent oxidoreductase [Nitrososphaeraceae archaeon]
MTSPAISNLPFKDKTVLITGSGTGIGQAIATKFAENGASIIIMGRRQKPLEDTKEILLKTMSSVGSSAKIISFPGVDVSDEQSLINMYSSIKSSSESLDIIVNNAGVSGPVKVFTNADYGEFKECVAIHLTGTFFTSVHGLDLLSKNGKIITISTFFTEESKFEQRPYRFRTPYTASQGAKNRLAEALAWELTNRGIRSIATNPGPVHSDRIYKTVYPKAAAEFLRIGGFRGMKSSVIEYILSKILPYLGGSTSEIASKGNEIAKEILKSKIDINSMQDDLEHNIAELIKKLYNIAEKIQENTKKMIVDGEFLSQEDVAEMVLTLSSEKTSRLLNGRVVPNDRVFYTVKPAISTVVQRTGSNQNLGTVLISTSSSESIDLSRIKALCQTIINNGQNKIIIISPEKIEQLSEFSQYLVNLSDEVNLRDSLNRIKSSTGPISGLIHFTGRPDYSKSLLELTKEDWESLINKFIHIPALVTKHMVTILAPDGALEEPVRFKESSGNVVIIGPDWPKGDKISGLVKARAELFRGALRPFIVTANQELSDVLGSKICIYLILPGNFDNGGVDEEQLGDSISSLISRSQNRLQNETIFCLGN